LLLILLRKRFPKAPDRRKAHFCLPEPYFFLDFAGQGLYLPEKQSFSKKKQKVLDLPPLKGYFISKRLLNAL
jgi:hypothetical protein